jgi:hypothetical protein
MKEKRNFLYAPTQLVAPSVVTIAVATDAMICMINLIVSFLLIILMFNFYVKGVGR